jgi:hypothetical protein
MPPAPERTDIYEKLGSFLKLPAGKLAGLADLQRKQILKENIQSPPVPLFIEVRQLLLEKCKREQRRQVRTIFEKEAFGEIERNTLFCHSQAQSVSDSQVVSTRDRMCEKCFPSK